MTRPIKILLGLLIIGVLLIILRPNRNGNQSVNTLKIGAILPLTGDLAYVGKEMQRGMELALQEAGDKNIKIVYEDDQTFEIKSSVNAVSKLVNADHVDVVLNSVVDTIKGLAPILNQKRVPGIVIWDNNKTIDNLGDYVYGMGFSTEHAGGDMAEMAYNKLGLRHISVISAFNEWSEIISQSFMEKFQSLGGAVDYQEKVELTTQDVRVNIAKILSQQSQAIYFPTYDPSLQSVIRQSRQLGFKGYLLTGDTLSDPDIKTLGQQAEGVYSTQPYLENPEFFKKYRLKYGQQAPAINLAFAGMGYDAVNFLLALKNNLATKGQALTPETLKNSIVNFGLMVNMGASTSLKLPELTASAGYASGRCGYQPAV